MQLDRTPTFERKAKELLTNIEKLTVFETVARKPHKGSPALDRFPEEFGSVLTIRFPTVGKSLNGHIVKVFYGVHDDGSAILIDAVTMTEWEEWMDDMNTEKAIHTALKQFVRILRGGM